MKQGLVFSITRSSFRDVLLQHLPFAVISGCVLIAAYFLPLDKFPLHICLFLRLTGYPCPSCGWTRGFVSMAHGNWPAVIYDCPLAAGLYILTAIVFACNVTALILGKRISRGTMLQFKGKKALWTVMFCCLLVLFNWIYRLAMGLK